MSNKSSFGNGNVLKAFDFQDIPIPASGELLSPYIDVSGFTSFTISLHNDSINVTVSMLYSIDGSNDVDKSYTGESFVYGASVNMTSFGPFMIKGKYMKMRFIGTPLQNINSQSVFRKAPVFSGTVQNIGGFNELYVNGSVSPAYLRTIQCSSGNISITQNANDIDISVIGGLVSPYQQIGDDISPLSVSTNCIISGTLNTLDPLSLNCMIGGSNSCSFLASNTNESSLISSTSSTIGRGTNSFICGGLNCNIGGPGGGGSYKQISVISCENTVVTNSGGNNSLIGCDNCTMLATTNSILLGSDNCNLGSEVSAGVKNNYIIGSINSDIQQQNAGATTESHNGIIGCNNCNMPSSRIGFGNVILASLDSNIGGSDNVSYNSIISASNCLMNDNTDHNVIIGGSNHTIDGFDIVSPGSENIILGGNNGSIVNLDRCVMMVSGSPISASANDQFTVKKAGGTRIYSNDGATSGVTLAPGSSSWAIVSDRNKKENIIEVNYSDIMNKVDKLPVYKYNYIGNDPRIKSCSVMAQDFYKEFPIDNVEKRNKKGEIILDEISNEPIMQSAKDMTKIEMLDLVGTLFACVKNLNNRIKVLEGV